MINYLVINWYLYYIKPLIIIVTDSKTKKGKTVGM